MTSPLDPDPPDDTTPITPPPSQSPPTSPAGPTPTPVNPAAEPPGPSPSDSSSLTTPPPARPAPTDVAELQPSPPAVSRRRRPPRHDLRRLRVEWDDRGVVYELSIVDWSVRLALLVAGLVIGW